MLRGEDASVSMSAALLAKEFRVVSLSGGNADEIAAQLSALGVTEAAVVAATAATVAAFETVLKHPQLVQSLALLAPQPMPAELAARLTELTTPVQAFFGTADPNRTPDAARNFCRSVPNCRLMYVFDTGAHPDDERPEAMAAALKEFAIKREKFLVTGKSSKIYS
ncbi:MAG: alpha/beta fold hydrolase [Xanthobacteraceae bacterium]